jgi:hypothetical protein
MIERELRIHWTEVKRKEERKEECIAAEVPIRNKQVQRDRSKYCNAKTRRDDRTVDRAQYFVSTNIRSL